MTTTNPPERKPMSDNMFAGCETAEAVMWAWAAWPRRFEERLPYALARIAELTPPKDENLRDHAEHILRVHGLLNPTLSTVDEAGRERAREALIRGVRERDSMDWPDDVLDRIIDALGWTAAEAEPQMTTDEYGRAACVCGYVPPTHTHADDCPVFGTQARAQAPTPAPATPAVELDVDTLERICTVLNCHENTRAAMDKLPMFGDPPDIMIPGALPMRITTNPFGVSVLRIGGGDE